IFIFEVEVTLATFTIVIHLSVADPGAVQHERGPRKPKLHLQLNHNSSGHHHQQAQHHHQQTQSQHPPGSNAHSGHNQIAHGALPPLPPLHPHAIMTGHHKIEHHQFGKLHLQGFNSVAPVAGHPLHSFQFPPAFFGHHASPMMKPVPAPGSSSASSSGSLPGPPAGVSGGTASVSPPGDSDIMQSSVSPSFNQPQNSTHPGMLHILMSAERCQELVWSAKQLQMQGDVMMSPPIPSPLALPLTPTWEVLQ
ncbi:homeotic protein deformed-like, partial [Ctenocephalides felis]|uniref:homeotic protein deformed-like n=1 Tax=Ctenocephalides felis TaxID=7515 RepID=UPI000E6E4B6B